MCQSARRIACDSRAMRRIALAIGVCCTKNVAGGDDRGVREMRENKKTVRCEKKSRSNGAMRIELNQHWSEVCPMSLCSIWADMGMD